jgi:hypothetical protein
VTAALDEDAMNIIGQKMPYITIQAKTELSDQQYNCNIE